MDVHTGETSRYDPSATAVVPAAPDAGQGRLFHDPSAHTFADTDQLPAITRDAAARRYGAPRWLRFTVGAVIVVILAAGVALALVESGVIGKSANPPPSNQTHSTTPSTVATIPTKNLLTPAQTFAGSGSASYTIPVRAFAITVTTGPGRSWVTIGIVGQNPIFQGIMEPNTSQREILLGPAEVNIGAGGTKVTVASGRHSQTLLPPSAPFTYQITPKG
jgi:hypothetical protein